MRAYDGASAEQMRVRSAGAREWIGGDHRLRTLNVEEVQDDARIRAKGAAEADMGEQRVGDLASCARHAYPQNLARRHSTSKLGPFLSSEDNFMGRILRTTKWQFAWRPCAELPLGNSLGDPRLRSAASCAAVARAKEGNGGGLAHICGAGRRVPV